MRCKACDASLSNKENTRKHSVTGEYIQLCDPCFVPITEEVPTEVNEEASEHTQGDWK